MPFELIQVTAAYSNAVLVAIMPHVSQFSKTLDLPIPQPVTVAQVRQFGCSPRADHIGGRVVLTNDYSFTFDLGAVVLYRSPHSYFSVQDPKEIAQFYGDVKVKKDDAIKIARNALKNLGYADSELHFNQTPKVTLPKSNEGKMIASYLVEWADAKQTTAGGIPLERTAVEVNASNGRIEMLGIQTKQAKRPDPKLDVHPQVVAAAEKSQPVGGVQMQPPEKNFKDAFLVAILPQVSEYITKAGIEAKTPIATNELDMPHYECWTDKADGVLAIIYLKNKDRFVYRHGQVIEYDAVDSQSWCAPNSPREDKSPEQFYGPVKVTSDDALAVVKKAIAQLGYAKISQLKRQPEIVPPRKEGANYFARYFFNWWVNGEGMQIAFAEVDATTKKLKALYFNDRVLTNIWQNPPFPPAQTNAPAANK